MANYLMKYKGTYKLKVEYDPETNDFYRDRDGSLIDTDVFISCKRGKIYHVGGSTLELWCTSKQIYNKMLVDYNDIILPEMRIDGDGEGSFRFNAKHIDIFAKEMKVFTSGKNMSPFSVNNLPKAEYSIPKVDLEKMKEVTKPLVDANKMYLITRAYKEFALDRGLDLKALSKEHLLKPKELYHKLGYFDELINHIGNTPLEDE